MDEVESFTFIYRQYFKCTGDATAEEIELYMLNHAPEIHLLLTENVLSEEDTPIARRLREELEKIIEVLECGHIPMAHSCIGTKMDRSEPIEKVVAHWVAARQLFPPDGTTFYEDLRDGRETLPLYREYLTTLL